MLTLRINRAIASTGLASRRGAEALIRAGRVSVNGAVVTALALTVDLERDVITVDGRELRPARLVYFLYHKPRGLITTTSDERGRPCVGDVCRALPGSPRPVGRLDRPSEGLLLLTNDGQLAQRLTHPRYGITKDYRVTVEPRLTERHARQLVDGITLDDGPARLQGIELRGAAGPRSRLLVTVQEGRYRLIRRVFAALGYDVKRLKRTRIGSLSLRGLPLGGTRPLSAREVAELRRQLKLR
jgi:23S rRNA pseudouridine2605 synthase